MKSLRAYAVSLLLISASYSCLAEGELKPFSGETPPLALTTLDGEHIDLGDFQGKLVLVQFWATYCTPCRVEMPSMNRLQSRMGDGFEILAVNMGEPEDEVRRFVAEVGPEFRILLDHDGSALQQWKVFAAPASFIVDPGGRIRYTLFGATEWDSDAMIASLAALQ